MWQWPGHLRQHHLLTQECRLDTLDSQLLASHYDTAHGHTPPTRLASELALTKADATVQEATCTTLSCCRSKRETPIMIAATRGSTIRSASREVVLLAGLSRQSGGHLSRDFQVGKLNQLRFMRRGFTACLPLGSGSAPEPSSCPACLQAIARILIRSPIPGIPIPEPTRPWYPPGTRTDPQRLHEISARQYCVHGRSPRSLEAHFDVNFKSLQMPVVTAISTPAPGVWTYRVTSKRP